LSFSSFWFCYNKEGDDSCCRFLHFDSVATKNATTVVAIAFLFGSVAMKMATTTSYCSLLLFGFVAVKKVTTKNPHCLLLWFCYKEQEEDNNFCHPLRLLSYKKWQW
jgi:hypothetical protein